MPTLDVTEILADPDFCDDIVVERRIESINQYGEKGWQTANISAPAVVESGTSDLIRTPEQQHMPSTIKVYTTFRLQGPSPGFDADVVEWHGGRYVVTKVNDWTNFGRGHVEAECSSITHIDQPPQA